MLYRQIFEPISSTYSYLLSSVQGREAVIIGPVLDYINYYVPIISELSLKLVSAKDTQTHTDHTTALDKLREELGCVPVIGEFSQTEYLEIINESDLSDRKIMAIALPVNLTCGVL
ncbi:hypothetical protein [Colwellia sp. C1TZA3]|uniref:hypothetical protein n=1 Tax=Colwellia sp. C1TZA3 TaxID=2508879 RepID=UPI0011BA3484|nr:hypothetical protein [Colwellia sp. C1TZA3]TWX70010.1 hypothetical protein ESZ39_11030 [Colwellia sp. C1TZA3]